MKYLLTFKPLKHFFFGNERTFKEDYVAVSEFFPQPTQLLGALRLTIAEQHGLIKQYKNGRYPRHPKPVTALTGTAKAHTFMHNDDLGKIKNLSGMFLVNNTLSDAYFPTPFDVSIKMQKVQADLSYCHLAEVGRAYYLEGYNVKTQSDQMLGNAAFWQAYLNGSESCIDAVHPYVYDEETKRGIFVKHTQVGIGLEQKQTIEGAFYSKTDYTLNEGFLFAAILDFDGNMEDAIVQIGAESSLFEMKVSILEETTIQAHPVVEKLFEPQRNGQRKVALSDAMFPDTETLPADFVLIPSVKRMTSVKMQKGKYVGLHGIKQIAPAGTVVYVKEGKTLSLVSGAYGKMGYNQFITI